MIGTLLKLGVASDAAKTIKDLEQTETGKFALQTAKAAIIISVSAAAIIAFLVYRSVNKTFGATKTDVQILKSQIQQKQNEEELN